MGVLFGTPKMPAPTPPPSAKEITAQLMEDVNRKNMSLERMIAAQRGAGVSQLRAPAVTQGTGLRLG